MACRRQPGLLDSFLRSSSHALCALALLLAPAAGLAAQLSQVRVGTHEDHTRIVLELDEAASYRLTPPGAAGGPIVIQLDATSAARHVTSKSPLVRSVRVEPATGGATVSVEVTKPGVEVSEMILADPPRIVLDVKPAGSMAAVPMPAPKPAPAPAPEPKVAETPPPARTAAAPTPTPAPAKPAGSDAPRRAPSLSDPVPSDVAPARPAEAAPIEKAEAEKPASPATPSAPADPTPSAGATPPQTKPASADASEPAPIRVAEKPAAPARPAAEVVVRKAPPPPSTADVAATGWADRLMSPTGYAAIGAVLLAIVVLAVRRRRRDEDDDPLYSVMSADDAGADDERRDEEDPVVTWAPREDDESREYEPAAASFDPDDEPISRDGTQQLALGRLRADDAPETDEIAEPEPEPDASSSLFDGAESIPVPPAATGAAAFAATSEPIAGGAARLASELENRVQDLERRLEQLTEARERLERQVAAQTEELRVQRAAIARTQRVVRSMTKGEELATEPVPRAPQA